MTAITRVVARTAVIPLETPVAFATRAIQERHFTLVRVDASDGVSGIGFCYSGHRDGTVVTAAVRGFLAPVLIGVDCEAIEDVWNLMYRETLLQGRMGAVMRGLSAVDIAMWDRNAKAAGLPLHRYLGGGGLDLVPAYASGGYYRDGATEDSLAEELRSYVDAGFTAVKIKVGRLGALEEERRVAAARDAIGPDIALLLDANNAWSTVEEALGVIERFEPAQPFLIEEPFGPDETALHAELVGRTSMLVATGEIESGLWRFREILERGAADILQPDAAVCGGITEFRRIAALAGTFGVPIAPHWLDELHIHLVASTPGSMFVEYFPDESVLNLRRLFDGRLRVDHGSLVLPSGPGLGVEFLDSALDAYCLDDWA